MDINLICRYVVDRKMISKIRVSSVAKNLNAKSLKRPTQTAFGSGVRLNGTPGN
jgi:hypothetical protein